jgi:hypothetical protein
MKKPKEDCVTMGGVLGAYFGALGGGTAGWILGGPLGLVLGIILGASAGILVGMGFGWVVCFLIENFGRGDDGGVSFAKPRFSNVRLVAVPDPAKKGAACRLELRWTVEGNDDHALCEIDYLITADAATPSPGQNTTPDWNNASTFGRAVSLSTTWANEHDGRLVIANVRLKATKDTEVYIIAAQPVSIRVPVVP